MSCKLNVGELWHVISLHWPIVSHLVISALDHSLLFREHYCFYCCKVYVCAHIQYSNSANMLTNANYRTLTSLCHWHSTTHTHMDRHIPTHLHTDTHTISLACMSQIPSQLENLKKKNLLLTLRDTHAPEHTTMRFLLLSSSSYCQWCHSVLP